MAELYDRSVRVTISPQEGGAPIVLTGVGIEFTVEKNRKPSADKCSVKIMNLADTTVARYGRKGDKFKLEAGYGGILAGLFEGDITRVVAGRGNSGQQAGGVANGVLEIESGDGSEALKTTISKNFDANATLEDVLRFAAQEMGIAVGEIVGKLTKKVGKGFSVTGLAKNAIKQIADAVDAEFSIQDNEVVIVQRGRTLSEETVILRPDTGLIGSPKATEDTIEAMSLLNHRIKPFGVVSLNSRSATGLFKVLKALHLGGNRLEDFSTTAVLEALQ